MTDRSFEVRFRQAVEAMDRGDIPALEQLLADHPELVRQRLDQPGEWLRARVGDALDGFFARPWLLWFVAEDPVRNGRLPANIAEVARTIIEAARRRQVESLQEQLDYGLALVCWSWVARDCGVQLGLIDVLADAGASLAGGPEKALVNGNLEAAAHLLERGAPLTLAGALCLGRPEAAAELARGAGPEERQFALVLAALRGRPEALRLMLEHGAEVNRPSETLFSHATPLHHAVGSGSLASVQLLVEAGASLTVRDTVHGGTPLGWAEHYQTQHAGGPGAADYAAIAAWLRARM